MRNLEAVYDLPEAPYAEVVGRELTRIERLIARTSKRPAKPLALDPRGAGESPRALDEFAPGMAARAPAMPSALRRGVRARLPIDLGKGVWDFIRVSDAVYLSLTDARYCDRALVRLPFEEVVKLRFLISGELTLQFSDESVVTGPGVCVSVHPGAHPNSYQIARGTHQRMAVLHCRRDYFDELVGQHTQRVGGLAGTALQRRDFFFAPFTANLSHDVSQLFEPPCSGPLGELFLEAKCTEILCVALQMLTEGAPAPRAIARVDLERVEEARRILLERLDDPPSIAELARTLGTNPTTLKTRFRKVTGKPIFEFVQGERLSQARNLLQDTDLSVTEIAFRMGYVHPGNFATAFRRRFRVSPRAYRAGQMS